MKLREFYEKNGVDYDTFLLRLMGKESLADKYIKIFLTDPTYLELANAVTEKDLEEVGKKAHTLKGIALNLSLKKLSSLCLEMINIVHSGEVNEIENQFALIKIEYDCLVDQLQG